MEPLGAGSDAPATASSPSAADASLADAREERQRGCYVGLDVGAVRLGVARLDDGVATPIGTWTRAGTRRDIDAVVRALARPPRAAVVGLPPAGDDPKTCSAERARRFAARLAAQTGWPVWLVDEADSSAEARERLQGLGLRAGGLRAQLDGWAAVVILQRFAAGAPAEPADLALVPAALVK